MYGKLLRLLTFSHSFRYGNGSGDNITLIPLIGQMFIMTLQQLVVKEGLITGNFLTVQFNNSELKIETEEYILFSSHHYLSLMVCVIPILL